MKKYKKLLLLIIYLINSISPFIVYKFNFARIYDNPFFRALEFVSGMVLAELFLHRKKSKVNNWIIILALGIESVFFIAIITYFQLIHILEIFNYSFVALIIFLIIIYQLAQLNDWKLGRYIFGNPMVQYLSKISFTFFLAQFFTFDLTKIVQSKFQWFNTFMNIKLIFTSLLICLMIAILLHEIVEKPMSKLLNKYVANKSK